MYIGEASKKSGLTVKAIRFYEEQGIITPPKRIGRYRVYTQSDIELFILIKEARELGLSLAELKGIVVYKDGKVDWKKIETIMQEYKNKLKKQVESLQRKIAMIEECCAQINS